MLVLFIGGGRVVWWRKVGVLNSLLWVVEGVVVVLFGFLWRGVVIVLKRLVFLVRGVEVLWVICLVEGVVRLFSLEVWCLLGVVEFIGLGKGDLVGLEGVLFRRLNRLRIWLFFWGVGLIEVGRVGLKSLWVVEGVVVLGVWVVGDCMYGLVL